MDLFSLMASWTLPLGLAFWAFLPVISLSCAWPWPGYGRFSSENLGRVPYSFWGGFGTAALNHAPGAIKEVPRDACFNGGERL
jgi:hypothetical protein